MAIPESKRRANDKYLSKCAQLNIKPLAEEAEKIKAAAAKAGQSTQGFILDAVRDKMRDDVVTVKIPRAQLEALAGDQDPAEYLKEKLKKALSE